MARSAELGATCASARVRWAVWAGSGGDCAPAAEGGQEGGLAAPLRDSAQPGVAKRMSF